MIWSDIEDPEKTPPLIVVYWCITNMAREALFETLSNERPLYLNLKHNSVKQSKNDYSLAVDMWSRVKSNDLFFSVEICPPTPKSESAIFGLLNSLEELKSGGALFCSVTWQAKTEDHSRNNIFSSLSVASLASNNCQLETMLHITGINLSKQLCNQYIKEALDIGINNILALRGDEFPDIKKPIDNFEYAVELVKHIRSTFGKKITIGVAGYPSGHPECKSYDEDITYLKLKVDAGSDFIITQIFFDCESFINFEKSCREVGITIPIIPGIMPIQSYRSYKHVVKLCRLKVPDELSTKMEELKDNDDAVRAFGLHYAFKTCKDLFESKTAPGIHIFTLNGFDVPIELCKKLGLWKTEPENAIKAIEEDEKGEELNKSINNIEYD